MSTYSHPPPFWKRYVDDTCTALPPDEVHSFHAHLNTIEPSIQFTYEMEENGILPFLDTEITHYTEGSLSTKVYRKPTHTDKYLDFQSHHPLAHKVAVVRTLYHRAERLCTFADDKTEEEQHVREALTNNGYPDRILTLPHPTHQQQANTLPEATVVIPYVNRTYEAVRRVLAPLGIRTYFKLHKTFKNLLTRVKDPVAPEEKAGVVYRVPCGDCPATYVGQTGRTLMHRLKEHKRALTTANSMTSALAEHAMDTGHDIDWSDAQIIDASSLLQQRCTLESWHIRRQPQPLNRERGMLPTVYDQLITQTSHLSS